MYLSKYFSFFLPHTHTLTHSGVNQIIWRKSLSVMSTAVTSRESCNSMRLDSHSCGKTNHQIPQHFEKKNTHSQNNTKSTIYNLKIQQSNKHNNNYKTMW